MTWALDDNLVRDILAHTGTTAEIAAEFGIGTSTVRTYKTLRVRRAAEIADMMAAEGAPAIVWERKEQTGRKFTDEQVAMIRRSKKSSAKLAAVLGCSPSTIRMVRTGKTYG